MAAATGQMTRGAITLKGSCELVSEYFSYCVNSILFQRGVYPPESFTPISKYGMRLWVTKEDGLKAYLTSVFEQVRTWLETGSVQKLVVVLAKADSPDQVLERWVFDVQMSGSAESGAAVGRSFSTEGKSEKEVREEIQAVLRQVFASVSLLPLLEGPVAFDMLVYTTRDTDAPTTWEESDPRYLPTKFAEVRLRSFDTSAHKVDTAVGYAL